MIFEILILGIYIIFTGIFIYLFYKNNFSIKETIASIKEFFSDFSFQDGMDYAKELLNKKDENSPNEAAEESDDSLENKSINAKKDSDEELPFDIHVNANELTVEQRVLMEEIAAILEERKQYVIDGGQKKLIIPLEATQFLTKDFNPLVNEHGEIIIKTKQKTIIEPKTDKKIEYTVFGFKDMEDLESQSDKELLENFQKIQEIKEKVPVVEEMLKAKINEKKEALEQQDTKEKQEEKTSNETNGPINQKNDEQTVAEPQQESQKEEESVEKQVSPIQLEEKNKSEKQEVKENGETKEVAVVNEKQVEKKTSQQEESEKEAEEVAVVEINNNFNNEIMEQVNSTIEEKIEEKENELEKKIKQYYNEIEKAIKEKNNKQADEVRDRFYKEMIKINKAFISDINEKSSIEDIFRIFNFELNIKYFFKLLATARNIFIDKKEEVFVNEITISKSIARLFGKNNLKTVFKLIKDNKEDFRKKFQETFSEYITEQHLVYVILENQYNKGEKYYDVGFMFNTQKSFKIALENDKIFYFFKRFPYEYRYNIVGIQKSKPDDEKIKKFKTK